MKSGASIARIAWTVCFALAGCGGVPQGVGFLRITEQEGKCDPPPAEGPTAIDLLVTTDFRRAHATTAFSGASRFPGGALIATAWQDADGTIARLQVDIGPGRGYGYSAFPEPAGAAMPHAVSYVEWKAGQRTFALQQAWGVLNYEPDEAAGEGDHVGIFGSSTGWKPSALFAHLEVDGTDAMGAPVCRVIGLHAMAQADRTESYDPAWLEADPTAQLLDAGPVPTYQANGQPPAQLRKAANAGPDPGGDPPLLVYHTGVNHGGGGGGCD